MGAKWTPRERRILERLDAALRSESAREAIGAIVARVEATMARDPSANEAWEPIPLEVYGPLPAGIRSSWVFILRAGAVTGAERHPNSVQRMISWKGDGDFQVHDGRRWRSHALENDPEAPLEERWISIPRRTWHQGVVGRADWVIVSFHTASPADLVEERPDPSDPRLSRRRIYLEVRQA